MNAEKLKKTHEQYKKTKQREVTGLKGEIKDKEKKLSMAPSQTDMDKLKVDAANGKITMTDAERAAAMNSKSNPRTAYLNLIKLCSDALDEAVIDHAATLASGPSTGAARAPFEFFDDSSSKWLEITDATVVSALKSLMARHSKKVTYSFGGHNYEASLIIKSGKNKAADYEVDQVNVNPQIKTTRKIRDTSQHSEDAASAAKKQMAKILFGSKSFVSLDSSTVKSMLSGFRFDIDQTDEPSLELAQLAEKFSSIGSGFKYTVPQGTNPQNAVDKCDGFQAQGTEFRTELFIKPIALFNWLTIARARGYTAARLVMHGGSKEAYNGVKADPIGFDMQYAGCNGKVFGNGLYFGLSDHATLGYNRASGLPAGSAILTLLLTHERIGWQHHSGSYSSGYDDLQAKQYKTITFSTPIEGIDNAIVVHEPPLTLPLGLVRAWDAKAGWVVAPNAYGQ